MKGIDPQVLAITKDVWETLKEKGKTVNINQIVGFVEALKQIAEEETDFFLPVIIQKRENEKEKIRVIPIIKAFSIGDIKTLPKTEEEFTQMATEFLKKVEKEKTISPKNLFEYLLTLNILYKMIKADDYNFQRKQFQKLLKIPGVGVLLIGIGNVIAVDLDELSEDEIKEIMLSTIPDIITEFLNLAGNFPPLPSPPSNPMFN